MQAYPHYQSHCYDDIVSYHGSGILGHQPTMTLFPGNLTCPKKTVSLNITQCCEHYIIINLCCYIFSMTLYWL